MSDIICKQTAKQINSRTVLYSMQRKFQTKSIKKKQENFKWQHEF